MRLKATLALTMHAEEVRAREGIMEGTVRRYSSEGSFIQIAKAGMGWEASWTCRRGQFTLVKGGKGKQGSLKYSPSRSQFPRANGWDADLTIYSHT